jgi:hypothetical protein
VAVAVVLSAVSVVTAAVVPVRLGVAELPELLTPVVAVAVVALLYLTMAETAVRVL